MKQPAKKVFSSMMGPTTSLKPRAIGFYAKGCMAGGTALPINGPAWQVMRLSRNRNWGQPELVALVERLATEAKEQDGWNGLLVGDLSQPRGGPMPSGHASHQVGLDADIWLTPAPDRILTNKEREEMQRQLVVKSRKAIDHVGVDGSPCAPHQAGRILSAKWRASSFIRRSRRSSANGPRETAPGWPRCAPITGTTTTSTSASIARQVPRPARTSRRPHPKDGTGCGEELAYWMGDKPWPKPAQARAQAAKARKPAPPLTLAALPAECRAVVTAE